MYDEIAEDPIVYLFLAILVTYLAWPVSLWLIVSGAIAIITHRYKDAMMSESPTKKGGLKRLTINALIKNIYTSSLVMTIGFTLIILTQLAFAIFSDSIDEKTVLLMETTLSSINQTLSQIFGLTWFLLSMAIIFVISICFPSLPILKNYIRVRSWARNLLLTLFILTSFTFFSSIKISGIEKNWIVSLKEKVETQERHIAEHQKELVSTLWLSQQIKDLPKIDKAYFKEVIYLSSKRENSTELVKKIAERTAKSAPTVQKKEPPPKILKEKAQSIEMERDPKVCALAKRYQANKVIERDLITGNATAAEALDLAIAKLLPIELHPMGKVFADTLQKSVIDGIAERISPISVKSLSGAVLWINLNLKSPSTMTSNQKRRWIWAKSIVSEPKIEMANSTALEAVELVSSEIAPKSQRIDPQIATILKHSKDLQYPIPGTFKDGFEPDKSLDRAFAEIYEERSYKPYAPDIWNNDGKYQQIEEEYIRKIHEAPKYNPYVRPKRTIRVRARR